MATTAASQQTESGEGESILRWVSPGDLFNLPLYEHHLVIDIRQPVAYALGHIATAVSYPSPSLECSLDEREKGLVKFVRGYVKEYLRPENPSPVVVYGDVSNRESQFHAEWLARKLEKLQKDRRVVARVDAADSPDADVDSYDDEQPFNHFEHFCLMIADRAREIWILEGGYDAFRAEYDFLCGNIEFSDMYPLPHEIDKSLLLGTRVFPITRDSLSKLRITHVIVSQHQDLQWQELEGIQVLACSVRDSNSQDMIPCWTACTKFIAEATATGGRTLVILFGRSRSTSVVIAYLIRTLRIKFEDAWSLVCNKCWHLIDRSLVYEEQLQAWEKMETAAITYQDGVV